MEDTEDWSIDAHGFYVANRSFLIRRGYCCANQCRNCPYINWRNSPSWRPLPAEKVQARPVSANAIEGAQKALAYHEEQGSCESRAEDVFHREMIAHYRLLLTCWKTATEKSCEISTE